MLLNIKKTIRIFSAQKTALIYAQQNYQYQLYSSKKEISNLAATKAKVLAANDHLKLRILL